MSLLPVFVCGTPCRQRSDRTSSVVERDITIAVVGASRAGKTMLAGAMAVSNGGGGAPGPGGRRATPPSTSRGFSARQFDVLQPNGAVCQVNVLVLPRRRTKDDCVTAALTRENVLVVSNYVNHS